MEAEDTILEPLPCFIQMGEERRYPPLIPTPPAMFYERTSAGTTSLPLREGQ